MFIPYSIYGKIGTSALKRRVSERCENVFVSNVSYGYGKLRVYNCVCALHGKELATFENITVIIYRLVYKLVNVYFAADRVDENEKSP